jgi:signal transduction histidine kinase
VANEFLQRFEVLLAVALLIPAIALALLAVLHKEIIFWRYASSGMLLISCATALSGVSDLTATVELILVSNLLCILGYYLCSKSIRQIYDFKHWRWLEEAGLLVFSIAVILVLWNSNSYEYLAATLSLCILYFLVFWGVLAARSWRHEKSVATAMIIILSITYGGVTAARALAALQVNHFLPALPFWDLIFIMCSLAVTFLFALAQFLYGNDLIQRQNVQQLQQVTNYLAKERELTSKLQDANKEQKNLQKLLLHEVKRPLSAIHAALQVNESTTTAINADRMERLRLLTTQANTYLEGIAQYQDIAELFEAPNWSLIAVSEVAQDVATKWGVGVVTDEQLLDQTLKCDSLLVDIAISNLVENAKKFSKTPAGVSVRLERVNGLLRLDVQDDGPGIPKAEWQHIWQKFYKLDTETKSALTGCGLGLHVVDQVAKVHSGHASVVSTRPSVVRLELPLAAGSNDNG